MKRAVCLIFIAGAAALAGCGGDDDSAPETPIVIPKQQPGDVSKASFIEQADGICAEVNAALGSLSSEAVSSGSVAGQRADLYEGMIERIRAIGEPSDAAGLDEFYASAEDIVAAQSDAEQAAQDGDDTALASAESEASTAEAAFADAADSYGFQDCGQGPTTPSTAVTGVPTAPAPAPAAPSAPVTTPPAPAPAAPSPGTTGTGGGTSGTGTGGGTTGGGTSGGTSGSGGVGPG